MTGRAEETARGRPSVLFGYFAVPALEEPDPVSQFLGRTSLLLVPVVLVAAGRRLVFDPLPLTPLPPTPAPADDAYRAQPRPPLRRVRT